MFDEQVEAQKIVEEINGDTAGISSETSKSVDRESRRGSRGKRKPAATPENPAIQIAQGSIILLLKFNEQDQVVETTIIEPEKIAEAGARVLGSPFLKLYEAQPMTPKISFEK